MTTYGEHRDTLAHALAELLAHHEPQLSRGDTMRVLGYRDSLLRSLTSMTDEVVGAAPGTDRSIGAAATAPARTLRTTLHRLPAAITDQAPTDLLKVRPRAGYPARWRTAARSALLAADALHTGHPATWRTHPDTAWAVMADTAAATHALAVLDRRLATQPHDHLGDDPRDRLHASWRTGLRLVASEVSRLAHSQPLGSDADHLARPPGLSPFPVIDANSLIAGYQHAHRILQARDGVLPIRVLGHVLVAQARIGHTLADHCQRAHAGGVLGAGDLADAWREHANTAETLDRHRRAVGGLHPGTHHPALAQLGEVLRAVQQQTSQGRSREVTGGLTTAAALAPTAGQLHRTLADGVERAFARDLYLVPNEHTTKRRGRLPWVSVRHSSEEHPLLTTARSIQHRAPRSNPPQAPVQEQPTPSALQHLHHALRTAAPARTGPPAMSQP